MSKSLGNTIAPQDVIAASGADILRLWVVSADYFDDQRIGKEILKGQVDVYRRFRNTLRYLLGALAGFDPRERLAFVQMPPLERWVLHRLRQLDVIVRDRVAAFDFHTIYTELHNFCASDLSAFYFDLRKDSLYCDRPDDLGRRAVRTVLDLLFDSLARWLAPILCFTAEEAWLARHGDRPEASVHLELFPEIPEIWADEGLARRWDTVRTLRRVVTGAIELERAAKRIGSSLQASVAVHAGPAYRDALEGLDLAELCIVSEAALVDGPAPDGAFTLPDVADVAAIVSLAGGEKCQRCWRVLPEVVEETGGLCRRCDDAVHHHGAGAAS
jgi:isoleucyl-tRNA synthetase